ncbi:hypothetical protein SAMN04487819_1082 [Actinopolyspora alba]|uniref:Uncharacterized protein n=1 Tax=Actinopolyspora alba TaxID=673379 RepID=A0A1I1XVW6_9ACTN|nr:hypothetical protein [Actinopolyspora alba]SFE11486.1 hypothetical protein SAMN04487819_1082 [Actinopolyspora alba]
MRNIPVNLGGYKLLVTEEPMQKTRERDGMTEVVTDAKTDLPLFIISLFAKAKGQKGEEIKVTLDADPGEVEEGSLVELVDARVSPFDFVNGKGEKVSGITFRAAGVTPAG